ncbi:MAG TPA: hypothetical protein VF247_00440 [Candidatus Krumholzibacteria bacterium]
MRHIARTLAALVLVVSATAANAFTIHGTVKNGTTGASADLKVTAIVPSQGMREVGAVDAKNGVFTLENMPNDAPMVMLRTDYAGVTYNTQVPVMGGGDQTVAVEVFDVAKSWDGINVMVPHLAVTRRGNELYIEQMYEVTNETSPPKTRGQFEMWLPADMDSIQDCYVIAGEVPVKRMPVPTDKKDIYAIEYPIRPGMTRVGISYSVPYGEGMYTMRARFPMPVAHMMVYAVDSTLQVTTTSHEFISQQSVHGMTASALHQIKAGEELILNFVGGDPNFAGLHVEGEDQHEHAGGEVPDNIRTVGTDDYKFSIFMMITVLLVLTGIVAMAMRDHHDPLSDAKVLRAHYDLLLARLAKLDDLHAANTIPSDAYRASREELMGRLAALAMQLRAHGGVRAHDDTAHAAPKTRVQ